MSWRLILAAIAVATSRHALAADLPTPSLPPPSLIAVYNWTGFYLGINGGFGTGNSNWSDGPIGTTGSFPTSGFLIGGTAGINYQIGEFVFGIEGDGDWTNLHGSSGSTCSAIAAWSPPLVAKPRVNGWPPCAAASATPSIEFFFTARPARRSAMSKPASIPHPLWTAQSKPDGRSAPASN